MTDKTFARALGNNIKAELRRKGLTQLDAAHALGMKSQSAISDRLNGDVRFAFDEVLALAAWLDVPLARLMEGLPTVQRQAIDGYDGWALSDHPFFTPAAA